LQNHECAEAIKIFLLEQGFMVKKLRFIQEVLDKPCVALEEYEQDGDLAFFWKRYGM
jgi:hypothetical protein